MDTTTELSGSHAGGSINDAIDTSGVNDILMAGDKSKGGRPYFFNSAETERVLNIAMAIATEVAVVRERLDTIERLLDAKGLLSQQEIEAFVPDEQQAEERQLWHARYAARILRIVQQELDAVAHPENNIPMQQIADDINKM
jgi:polyhydroxyalkanoate synthesis regulator phasin